MSENLYKESSDYKRICKDLKIIEKLKKSYIFPSELKSERLESYLIFFFSWNKLRSNKDNRFISMFSEYENLYEELYEELNLLDEDLSVLDTYGFACIRAKRYSRLCQELEWLKETSCEDKPDNMMIGYVRLVVKFYEDLEKLDAHQLSTIEKDLLDKIETIIKEHKKEQ